MLLRLFESQNQSLVEQQHHAQQAMADQLHKAQMAMLDQHARQTDTFRQFQETSPPSHQAGLSPEQFDQQPPNPQNCSPKKCCTTPKNT